MQIVRVNAHCYGAVARKFRGKFQCYVAVNCRAVFSLEREAIRISAVDYSRKVRNSKLGSVTGNRKHCVCK